MVEFLMLFFGLVLVFGAPREEDCCYLFELFLYFFSLVSSWVGKGKSACVLDDCGVKEVVTTFRGCNASAHDRPIFG